MDAKRVGVIGGGPAGLFSARLLALGHPDWEVTVYERLPPDDTFGFGVGLTERLMEELTEADPIVCDRIAAADFGFAGAEFRLPQGISTLPWFHAGAIGRARLLRELTVVAEEAGVKIVLGEAPTVDELSVGCDLVIAADGASSLTRAGHAEQLEATESVGRGLFIWCGSEAPLPGTVFFPARTEAGLFVAHCYPYAEDRSTYVVETDEETLRRAGCWQEEFAEDADSDEGALAYLSEAFSELLGGRSFIGNRSRWMRFRTIYCARWHFDNVVLLGDSKATVHPSIGSGTKLALEDAIALAAVMENLGDRSPASMLERFETERRPAVDHLQARATDSQLWWESFAERAGYSPSQVGVAYLSRAGAVSLDDLLATRPELARAAAAEFAGVEESELPDSDLAEWVLRAPLEVGDLRLPNRLIDPGECAEVAGRSLASLEVDTDDPWGERGDALVAAAGDLAREGAAVVRLDGPEDRNALLDRLALAERLRNEVGVVTAVEGPEKYRRLLVDGLVAGRTDLAAIASPSPARG